MKKRNNFFINLATLFSILTLLVIVVSGCGTDDTTDDAKETASAETSFVPGTYEGVGDGYNGPVQVEVVFSEESIDTITVIEHSETEGIADVPLERIPQAVVDNQSLAVDVVSAATATSNALLAAIEDAVSKAEGDVAALKNKDIEEAVAGDLVKKEADVIVVGGGGAGVAAAISAAEEGASVIVVEKTSALGGNTVRSGGAYNSAYQSVQKDQDMTDIQLEEIKELIALEPQDEHMERWQDELRTEIEEYEEAGSTYLFDSIYLHMIQTYVDGDYVGNPILIENMCATAPATYDWMDEHGMKWKDSTSTFVGALWPRCHVAEDYKSGLGFIDSLTDFSDEEDLPIEFIYEVEATDLMLEDDKVVGAKGLGIDQTPYEFSAKKSVILATGGFGANVDMRVEYNTIWEDLGEDVKTTNSPAIVGDGIVMAENIGAELVDMDKIQLLPVADPRSGITSTIVGEGTNMWINQDGVRFVNEYERRDVLAAENLKQPGNSIYIISSQQNSRIDEDGLNSYGLHIDDLLETGVVFRADTLEDLAKQIDVDPDTFIESVEKFNESADTGIDEEFGRGTFADTSKIEEGPYYACARYPAVHHTMGGVKVDEATHVLDSEGNAIPGLFAAGEVTGGLHGANRLGGNAITDCLTNGRIAGTNATK